ncbi:MAG: thioredoxin fold domain-containing protein, partial [Saprospiraceae bacterium]|nr:thioredoxin fold domain-containing protein [Saprospiraceae bacterium]
MKNRTLLSILLLLLFAQTNSFALEDLFVNASLEQVEKKAAIEGKLYLIDFYASWCLPCKWMDETTFSDDAVTNYLKTNYISLKVNIDDFDGFGIKEKYQVSVLPTVIIFNSSGKIVERLEESVTPSKLLNILETHNYYSNRVKHDIPEPVIEAPT